MSEHAPRLSLADLDGLPTGARPGYDPRDVNVGIVHLGIGAFSRAHQAVFTDEVLAADGGDWGICGVSQRSRTVPEQLGPQDGLYTVLERDADRPPRAQVVGAVREVRCAADEPDVVVDRIGAGTTRIVTLTVTEKGYRYDPGTGRLRDDPVIAEDLAGGDPTSVVGQLVRGLQRRRRNDAGPIAVVSCDNLSGNGTLLQGLVSEFASRLPAGESTPLLDFIESHATFPKTMVDRIVPATTDADREEVARLLGRRDHAAVVAEPFSQWVIEDDFLVPRPAWERVGVTITDDVDSYERVKLRLLNAAHSLIAYLGALAGYATIAEALDDEAILAATRRLLDEDQMPTLVAPDGLDLAAYRDEVLHRFANPALGHRTTQVAMDGSQKLPQRLVGALREQRAADGAAVHAALLVAAWMRVLAGHDDRGEALAVEDPMGDTIGEMVAVDDAHLAARRVLAMEDIFGAGMADDETFVTAVADWYEALRSHGVLDTLRAVAG